MERWNDFKNQNARRRRSANVRPTVRPSDPLSDRPSDELSDPPTDPPTDSPTGRLTDTGKSLNTGKSPMWNSWTCAHYETLKAAKEAEIAASKKARLLSWLFMEYSFYFLLKS